jgi:hypothetical protein
MHAPPPGRVRPVLVIFTMVAALVLVLEMLGRQLPAFHALARDTTVIVVAIGIVGLIRALLPRRSQRRHGERRHMPERRASPRGG